METSRVSDSQCRLEIDCAQIAGNLSTLKKRTDSPIMAVLKNEGYGLTLEEYARLLSQLGITRFAVGTGSEALALRDAGIQGDILLLTPELSPAMLEELIRQDISLTIGSKAQAQTLLRAAEAAGRAPGVHLKIDTGLGRYGFLPEELPSLPLSAIDFPILGTYTHFASPYTNAGFTECQYRLFLRSVDSLRQKGFETGLLHCCASGALLLHPEMHLDMVRIGSALLGCVPNTEKYGLKPAVTLSAPITEIRPHTRSGRIGYHLAVRVKKSSRIGIVSTGYASGYRINRRLRGLLPAAQYAAVAGKKARVLGFLGINTLALDLTGIPTEGNGIARFPINPLYCSASIPRHFL